MSKLSIKSAVLAILLAFGVGTLLHAQQEAPKTESIKKVIIKKKTIDENGNEVIEEIIKEGDEVENFHFEHFDGNGEIEVRVLGDDQGNENREIRIFSNGEEINVEEIEELEELDLDIDIDTEEILEDFHFNFNEDNGTKHFKFKIQSGEDGPKTFEWKGTGEMPAELQEQLKDMEIEIKDLQDNLGQVENDFMHGYATTFKSVNGGCCSPYLGVVMTSTEQSNSGSGVTIGSVSEGSAAEKAGLRAGDVITDIDGQSIQSFSDLSKTIKAHEVGDEVNIAYVRDGNVQTTNATLGEKQSWPAKIGVWSDNDDFTVTRDLPCLLIGVYTETVKSVPGSEGVRVTSIIEDTPAEDIAMKTGDVILSLNGVVVNEHNDLTIERDKHAPGDKVSIVYLRDGRQIADEITFRECNQQDKVGYVVRRGPNSKREVKKKKRIIIIKKKQSEEGDKTTIDEVTTPETAVPREAPGSIGNLELTAFRAFPNPTDGVVTVRFEGEAVPTVLKISDISGREIYREDMDGFPGWYSNRVDLGNAAPGTLLLTVEQNGQIFTEKVILTEGNRP